MPKIMRKRCVTMCSGPLENRCDYKERFNRDFPDGRPKAQTSPFAPCDITAKGLELSRILFFLSILLKTCTTTPCNRPRHWSHSLSRTNLTRHPGPAASGGSGPFDGLKTGSAEAQTINLSLIELHRFDKKGLA